MCQTAAVQISSGQVTIVLANNTSLEACQTCQPVTAVFVTLLPSSLCHANAGHQIDSLCHHAAAAEAGVAHSLTWLAATAAGGISFNLGQMATEGIASTRSP